MALDLKTGKTVKVTISKTINRDSAYKTLERLFLKDKKISAPIEARSSNFEEKPKRRGGCIWTKRPNKVHAQLPPGTCALVKLTAQSKKDLDSVSSFVKVSAA